MSEQLALPGPYKTQCPCGFGTCTQFGKPMKSGHVRGCPCARCRAGRNSRQGKAAHRKVARQLGAATAGRGSSSHEESWVFDWRVEVKTGQQAFVPVTRFLDALAQSEVSRAYGDSKPFAAIFDSRRKGDPTVVVMDLETFQRMAAVTRGEDR